MHRSKYNLSILTHFTSILAFLPAISFSTYLLMPSFATNEKSPPITSFPHTGILQENMSLLLGIDEKQVKLNKVEPATWQDCVPTPGRNKSCQPVTMSGFRATMSANGENWIYYVSKDGNFIQDNRASLNSAILKTLANQLKVSPTQLNIRSVKMLRMTTSCPQKLTNKNANNKSDKCQPKSTVEWQVLTNLHPQPFQFKLNGNLSNFPQLPNHLIPVDTAKLPKIIISKVLQDVVFRNGTIEPNLKIVSIKPTVWNWCQGKSPGPTRPDMGACLNVDQPGWQIIVKSGENRYFYYIPQAEVKNPSNYVPVPDGMQSLPTVTSATVKKDAVNRGNISSVLFAQPSYFDACLNLDKQTLKCRNGVQGGWVVTFTQPETSIDPPAFKAGVKTLIYHLDSTGKTARFAANSNWLPKP